MLAQRARRIKLSVACGYKSVDPREAPCYPARCMQWLSLIHLVYPPTCLVCQRRISADEACVCAPCERAMPRVHPPVCQHCGQGLPGAYDALMLCRLCQRQSPAFDQAGAPFRYAGAVRDAVHAFKYQGHRRLGLWLADAMAELAQPPARLASHDLIVPVPMHWVKQRMKGFNPAEGLAQAVGARVRQRCARTALRRTRWTATQTRLTRTQRARNVRGAFRARPDLVQGRHILLIDDVLTTGATAHACALALRDAGASSVSVLTAAAARA